MARTGERSPDGFMSVVEAADFLGLHPESVLRGVRRETNRYPLTVHERPGYRTHRKFFFRVQEVQDFAAELVVLRS